MKTCPHCKLAKEYAEFYKNAHGYSSWCKNCVKKWSKQQVNEGYFRKHRPRRPKTIEQKYFRFRPTSNTKGRKPTLTPIQKHASNVWFNAKKRALRNGKKITITRELVEHLIAEFCKTHHYSLDAKNPFLPSLDKIDYKRSYEPDNVRIVWLIENYARNTFSDEQVIEFCKRKLGQNLTDYSSKNEVHKSY